MEKFRAVLSPGTVIAETHKVLASENREAGAAFFGAPDFLRLVLHARPGPGSFIVSEVWLPDEWNGELVAVGNGGMAGGIPRDRMLPYLRGGFATATTDMGTSRGVASGVGNPDVWKDFGWRATYLMALDAKALATAQYGRAPQYSYFVGDSTGGQQAMAMVQRFPALWDGVIAGAPAFNRVFLHTYFLWNRNHLRTEDGPLFSRGEIDALRSAAVAFAQGRGDGQPGDDFLSLPDMSEEATEAFLDYLGGRMPALSPAQRKALRAVYLGPVNPRTGERIYCGMPIGSEPYGCGIDTCQQPVAPHFYPFQWTFGLDYIGERFDFDRDLETVSDLLSAELNANSTDLSGFRDRGGKLIMYSGAADPCVPFPDALAYYLRVADRFGGSPALDPFFRYFLLPGRDHGSGGHGVKHLAADPDGTGSCFSALRDWVRTGQAPAYLVGVGERVSEGRTERFTRIIHPFDAAKAPANFGSRSCSARYLAK